MSVTRLLLSHVYNINVLCKIFLKKKWIRIRTTVFKIRTRGTFGTRSFQIWLKFLKNRLLDGTQYYSRLYYALKKKVKISFQVVI